jgi:hypothetical protein
MKTLLGISGLLMMASLGMANMGQFPMMAGQGMPGQMIQPNQPVAMDPGAYQSQFNGTGDIPPWAIQQGHLCGTGRFENTNNFNFGPNQVAPGMPGYHQ